MGYKKKKGNARELAFSAVPAILGISYLISGSFTSGILLIVAIACIYAHHKTRGKNRFKNRTVYNNTKTTLPTINTNRINPHIENTVEIAEKNDPTKWSLNLIQELEWRRLEKLCLEYFKMLGHNCNETGKGADGGIDIQIKSKTGEKLFAIQCKAWKKPIGIATLREMNGLLEIEGFRKGLIITSGKFSKEALEFEQKAKNIRTIDGEKLLELIQKMPENEKSLLLKIVTNGDYKTPSCPNCDIKLVKRNRKKDGSNFWGCPNFPKCRYILNKK